MTTRHLYRRAASVRDVVSDLAPNDQARVYRTAFSASTISVNDAMLFGNIKLNEARTCEGLFAHIKNNRMSWTEMCSLLYNIYGEEFYDDDLLTWLQQKLNRRKTRLVNQMNRWRENSRETRGRPGLSKQDCQDIHDIWHTSSIVTVDRRNGRDTVKIENSVFQVCQNHICRHVIMHLRRRVTITHLVRIFFS